MNNVLLESILDHIYVKDPTLGGGGVQSIKPCFGGHFLISLTLLLGRKVIDHSIRRDWRKYSQEVLLSELALVDWNSDLKNVQNVWDDFKSKLVKVVDKIVPLMEFKSNTIKSTIPNAIRNKINKNDIKVQYLYDTGRD